MSSLKTENGNNSKDELQNLQKRYYSTLSNFFSGGTYDNILLGLLARLNTNIKKADESSTRLAKILNRITLIGTIIAALSLIIAVAAVALEYIKFFCDPRA